MATKTIDVWSSWEEATPRSRELFRRAQQVLPGGINSPVRGTSCYEPYPIYLDRGEGCHVVDVDGHNYVDLIMGLGPVILGHAHPAVTKAITDQAHRGSVFATCVPLEVEVAEQMCRMVPSLEMVRFTNSGTESTMHAIRLARGYTGKEKILKFEGHFHGNHDQVLVSVTPPLSAVGSASSPNRIPVGSGIPYEHYVHTLVAVWNDIEALERVIKAHRHELAAVIVEPIMANKGFIPPNEGYLKALREITRANDILLIMDEVITGFRLAPGGAQQYYEIDADLATYAKAMGNGATIGAFGGSREIMTLLSNAEVRHAGTYNGALGPLAATKATLAELSANGNRAYEVLNQRGEDVIRGLEQIIDRSGIPAIVQGGGSMLQLFFTQTKRITSYRETHDVDHELFQRFAHGMIARGVMVHPDAFEHWFLSTAHQKDDIGSILDAAENTIRTLRPTSK